MAINGKFGGFEYDDQKVRGGHHPAVVLTGMFMEGIAAMLALGMFLARGLGGKLRDWLPEIGGVLGEGDGTETTFVFDLGGAIEPGSLEITDGVETFSDDGFGTLTGDGDAPAGSGKIDYASGKGTVTFKLAPLDEAEIEGTWEPGVVGVLDENLHPDRGLSALYVVHGIVRRAALKVSDGDGGYTAPDAAMLGKLAKTGIWAE